MSQPPPGTASSSTGRVWIVSDSKDTRWAAGLHQDLEARGYRAGIYPLAEAVARVALASVGGGLERLRSMLPNAAGGALLKELERSPPRLVIVGSPDAARVFSQFRQALGGSFGVLALIDDFRSPEAWVDVDVDFVVAPTGEQLDLMGAGDLAAERRIIAGPPTPFDPPPDGARARLRASLDADDETLVVLIDASTMSAGTIDQVVYQVGTLGPRPDKFELLFYTGDESENARALREATAARRVRARMFGASMPIEGVLAGVDLAIVSDVSRLARPAVFLGVPLVGIGANAPLHALAQHGVMVPLQQPSALGALLQEIRRHGVAPSQREATEALRTLIRDEDVFEAIVKLLEFSSSLSTDAVRAQPRSKDGLEFEELGGTLPASPEAVAPAKALSPAAAREEYARVVLEQRRLEKLHESAVVERDTWLTRRDDAIFEEQKDLIEFAEQMLERSLQDLGEYQRQLDALRDAKDELRQRFVDGPKPSRATMQSAANTPAMMEKRFVEMESRRQLRDLRERAKRGR